MQHRPPASALPVINATGPQSTVPVATLASRQSTVPELAPASARRGLASLSHQLRSAMQTPHAFHSAADFLDETGEFVSRQAPASGAGAISDQSAHSAPMVANAGRDVPLGSAPSVTTAGSSALSTAGRHRHLPATGLEIPPTRGVTPLGDQPFAFDRSTDALGSDLSSTFAGHSLACGDLGHESVIARSLERTGLPAEVVEGILKQTETARYGSIVPRIHFVTPEEEDEPDTLDQLDFDDPEAALAALASLPHARIQPLLLDMLENTLEQSCDCPGDAKIFGNDDRRWLVSGAYPFRCVGTLRRADGGSCSATLIGPATIATAAHCLKSDWKKGKGQSGVTLGTPTFFVANIVPNMYPTGFPKPPPTPIPLQSGVPMFLPAIAPGSGAFPPYQIPIANVTDIWVQQNPKGAHGIYRRRRAMDWCIMNLDAPIGTFGLGASAVPLPVPPGNIVGWVPPRELSEGTLKTRAIWNLGYPGQGWKSIKLAFEAKQAVIKKVSFKYGRAKHNYAIKHAFDTTDGASGGPMMAFLDDAPSVSPFQGQVSAGIPCLAGVLSGTNVKNWSAGTGRKFMKVYKQALAAAAPMSLSGKALADGLILPKA